MAAGLREHLAVAVVASASSELVKLEHGKPDHYAHAENYCLQAMLAPSRLSHVCWLGPHTAGLKVAGAAACSESRVAE